MIAAVASAPAVDAKLSWLVDGRLMSTAVCWAPRLGWWNRPYRRPRSEGLGFARASEEALLGSVRVATQ